MTIYKILNDSESFLEFNTDLEEMLDHIGPHTGELEFIHFSRHNLRLKSYWKTFTGNFKKVRTGATLTPDISCWRGATIVLSQQAYEALAEPLTAYGEFLPITCNKLPYYIFNCLQLAEIDTLKSKQEVFEGGATEIASLAFDSDSIQGKLVFKSQYEGCTAIFCSENFKNMINKLGFKGITFQQNLTSIF
ncbi:MAG: DUF1629 domain-containing protein [Pseudomonadota bacterium]